MLGIPCETLASPPAAGGEGGRSIPSYFMLRNLNVSADIIGRWAQPDFMFIYSYKHTRTRSYQSNNWHQLHFIWNHNSDICTLTTTSWVIKVACFTSVTSPSSYTLWTLALTCFYITWQGQWCRCTFTIFTSKTAVKVPGIWLQKQPLI